MAFFGIFGNKGIDSLSVDEIKKECGQRRRFLDCISKLIQ